MAIQNGSELAEFYPKCDKISIDYGIMEKVDPAKVRIIPADLGWSDIGTFASLHEELADSPHSNLTKGDVVAVDCEGTLLYNEGPEKIAAFGLKDMVVVSADGFVLLARKRKFDLKLFKKLHEESR